MDEQAHDSVRHAGPRMSGDEALARLVEGSSSASRANRATRAMRLDDSLNWRRASSRTRRSSVRRLGGAAELIFDAGPGELFVIRVAGNVLSPEVAEPAPAGISERRCSWCSATITAAR